MKCREFGGYRNARKWIIVFKGSLIKGAHSYFGHVQSYFLIEGNLKVIIY